MRWSEGPRRWRDRGEEGQSAFEFMAVLPFVFLFIYAMVEGVFFLEQFTVIDHAVRDGARYASKGYGASDVKSCTVTRAGSILSTSNVNVSYPGGNKLGQSVTVQVQNYTYNFTSSLRGLTFSIPLNAQTTMRIESTSPPSINQGSTCQ